MYRIVDGCGYDIRCKGISDVQGVVLQHGITIDNVLSLFVYSVSSNTLGYIPYYAITNITELPKLRAKDMFNKYKAQAYSCLGKDAFANFSMLELNSFGFRQENGITEGDIIRINKAVTPLLILSISARPDLAYGVLSCLSTKGEFCEVPLSTGKTIFELVNYNFMSSIFDKYMLATSALNYATLISQGKVQYDYATCGVARAELANISNNFDKQYMKAVADLREKGVY